MDEANKLCRLSDAEMQRIQEEFRIPVDSFYPGTYWIISLDRNSHMPSDKELRQMASYREFVVRDFYNHNYAEKILAKPLPKDAGHNTMIFRKGSERPLTDTHWFWRKTTWRDPIYVPSIIAADYRGFSLVQAMDNERHIFYERWTHWKSVHSAVFP